MSKRVTKWGSIFLLSLLILCSASFFAFAQGEQKTTLGAMMLISNKNMVWDELTFRLQYPDGNTQDYTSQMSMLQGLEVYKTGTHVLSLLENEKYEMDALSFSLNEEGEVILTGGKEFKHTLELKAKSAKEAKILTLTDTPIKNADKPENPAILQNLFFSLRHLKKQTQQEYESSNSFLRDIKMEAGEIYEISLVENPYFTMEPQRFYLEEKDNVVIPKNERGELVEFVLHEKKQEEPSAPAFTGLSTLQVKVYQNEVLMPKAAFRLFRFDGRIPNVVASLDTGAEGTAFLSEFEANKSYEIAMESRVLKFAQDRIRFETNGEKKVSSINGKAVKETDSGVLEFKGVAKSEDVLPTTELSFTVLDMDSGKAVEGVELTANILLPRLSSYKNAVSDAQGLARFQLEGQTGGKQYTFCVSKNGQFLWDFEPKSITVSIDEQGKVSLVDASSAQFRVRRNDKSHLKTDLAAKIQEAESYLQSKEFTNPEAVKQLQNALAAAKEELAKPETIPQYVQVFLDSVSEALENLKKFEKLQPEEEKQTEKTEESKPESRIEEKKEEKKEDKTNAASHTGSSSGGGSVSRSRQIKRSASANTHAIRISQEGQWIQNPKGWWYSYKDGSYPKSSWLQDKGKWYYFDSQGYMVKGWVEYSGKWYYLAADGAMLVSGTTPDGYKVDAAGIWIP